MSQPKNNDREDQGEDKKTILIVDDSQDSVGLLSRVAERFGYNTIPAFSGEEALELFRKNKPNLITVDIGMPGMDGYELVSHIRKIDSLVPIIFVTAYAMREDRERGLAHGADAYINKPVAPAELFEEVGALLNKTPIELEKDRLKFSNSLLSSKNTYLKKQIEALKGIREIETADVDTEKHHAVYATIAHDMTNEFAQIGGALRAIRHLAADSEEIQEECDLIERSLHYFGQLLRRLKNYTEIAKPHLEPVDISELMKRVESMIRPRMPSNILFEVGADHSTLDGKVLVDADQVIGALIEITNNAVHALRSSEGVVKLDSGVRDGMLIITVSNNGPGIPDDIRKKLFKQQVSSSKEKGTGMGLFLANQVLSAFGGKISLEGPSTDWITFTIQLPLYEPQKDE